MPKVDVPITGSVLRWAIEEGGYSLPGFARKVGVELGTLSAWIAESMRPGKSDLFRIANVLKRPTAMFLLPRRPATRVTANLRKARGPEDRPLSPDERIAVRWVLRLQRTARGLLDGPGEVDLPLAGRRTPESAANEARGWLGVSIDAQVGWQDERMAFWAWKEALERRGVFVVQLQLGEEGVRGFSSWDESAPFVVVNQSADPNYLVRTFSLVHELGHLARRDDAACDHFSWRSKQSEYWCDSFAGAFLLPRDRVEAWLSQKGFSVEEPVTKLAPLKQLAQTFKVSLRATAIRLIDLGLAPSEIYGVVERVARPRRNPSNRPGGPSTVDRRRQELGPKLAGLFIRAERASRLTELEVSDYLRVPYTQLPDLASAIGETI